MNSKHSSSVAALERSGQPVVRLDMSLLGDSSQRFFQWELAPAVAGAILGINAFDQTDVGAGKVEARKLTGAHERTGAFSPERSFYVQRTCDDPLEGRRLAFGMVKAAQARGNLEVLTRRSRRVLRVHPGRDIDAGLDALAKAIADALE